MYVASLGCRSNFTFVPQLKRWEIKLDIAAPQIILPEKFVCENTNMIVLDLGHIKFHNTPTGSPASEPNTNTEGRAGVCNAWITSLPVAVRDR